jgi:hypothetical protein
MQIRDLERAQRLGIADAAGAAAEWVSRAGNEFAKAIPDRVCSEKDGWTVMFVMPSGACVGVDVAGDGSANDIDPALICERWRNQDNCSPVTFEAK